MNILLSPNKAHEHRSVNLRVSLWFRLTNTGKLQRLRVSKAAEQHFPLELRKIYQQSRDGAVAITKHLKETKHSNQLSPAWQEVKHLFNNKPGVHRHG